jgi:hypothetical protein
MEVSVLGSADTRRLWIALRSGKIDACKRGIKENNLTASVVRHIFCNINKLGSRFH